MTYNPNLEEDLKLWLASPDDDYFQQYCYLPLLNYTAGILLRINPTATVEDRQTMLADVITQLPKYSDTKGCTLLSYVRHLIQWIHGQNVALNTYKSRAKFRSIYNEEGEVDESVCGITEPITTEETERKEEYQALLKELIAILTFKSSQPGKSGKTRQAQFETELLKVLKNKSNGYDVDAHDNCGLFGCKLGKHFRHHDITKALTLVRKKVKRSKEKTQDG